MKRLVAPLFIILFFAACEKEDDEPDPQTETCDVRGVYVGTGTRTSPAQTSYSRYELKDDNFVLGYESAVSPVTTWGGYRSTCDSVILSLYYKTNLNYYVLRGKFSNNRTVLSGTFTNLTTPADFGTFTLTKQ